MAVKEIPNNLFFNNIKDIINSGNSVELRIKGTSMHPTLLNGKHKVVLIPYQKKYLRVGTIALFLYNEKHLLHRLVSVNKNRFIFQGDNLPYIREYVKEENIIAIVEYIITPTGKVIDCKKQGFFVRNRLWRPVYHYQLIFVRKIKGILTKVLGYNNRRLWNKK